MILPSCSRTNSGSTPTAETTDIRAGCAEGSRDQQSGNTCSAEARSRLDAVQPVDLADQSSRTTSCVVPGVGESVNLIPHSRALSVRLTKQPSVDQWSGRTNEPDPQGGGCAALPLRTPGSSERHLGALLAASNFAKRLNTLCGLTPFEAVCKAWPASRANSDAIRST